jgi:hypothetical protein
VTGDLKAFAASSALVEVAPTYANGAAHSSEGSNTTLLVVGALLLLVGVGSLRGSRALAGAALALGVVATAAAFIAPRLASPDVPEDVGLSIVSPSDGKTVPAQKQVNVQVALENADIATSPDDSGGHLHLFVDGELVQMPYATTMQVRLPPGSHEITVEYVDEKHVSYDPPFRTSVEVRAE